MDVLLMDEQNFELYKSGGTFDYLGVSGLNVNSVVLVTVKGLINSSLMTTKSPGRLSVIVMRPSPTCLLPSQAYCAPVPACVPE